MNATRVVYYPFLRANSKKGTFRAYAIRDLLVRFSLFACAGRKPELSSQRKIFRALETPLDIHSGVEARSVNQTCFRLFGIWGQASFRAIEKEKN